MIIQNYRQSSFVFGWPSNTLVVPGPDFQYLELCFCTTVYSGCNGHAYSGHSDRVASFPGTKYIYSMIFRSDVVAKQIE